MTTTDHEGRKTVTDQDLIAARAAIVRVMELLEDAEGEGHRTVAVADVRALLTTPGPGRLCPGMKVRLPAEVLDEIAQGAVLGLRNGACVVVPTDPQATGAEIIPWSAA